MRLGEVLSVVSKRSTKDLPRAELMDLKLLAHSASIDQEERNAFSKRFDELMGFDPGVLTTRYVRELAGAIAKGRESIVVKYNERIADRDTGKVHGAYRDNGFEAWSTSISGDTVLYVELEK